MNKPIEATSFLDNPPLSYVEWLGRALDKSKTNNTEFIEDYDTLVNLNQHGGSVAHYQTILGWRPTDKKVLLIKNCKQQTVAEMLIIHSGIIKDTTLLKHLLHDDGVANAQIKKGWKTQDKELLAIKNRFGSTVAHKLAFEGNWIPEEKEILFYANSIKDTVAHILTNNGWTTNDSKLLQKKNSLNYTVQDSQILYLIEKKPQLLNLELIKQFIQEIKATYPQLRNKTRKQILKYFKKNSI